MDANEWAQKALEALLERCLAALYLQLRDVARRAS